MATDATRAEEAKQLGNAMFSKGKMQAAIDAYSEAICFDPNEPVYYTNRAMCHRRKESWEAVIADCRTALLLDDASIKGHYLLGVALDAGGEFEPAVQHLFRALELCKDRTVAYKEDIQRAMLLTRKRQWQANAPSSDAQVATASRVLTQLVSSHALTDTRIVRGAGSVTDRNREARRARALFVRRKGGGGRSGRQSSGSRRGGGAGGARKQEGEADDEEKVQWGIFAADLAHGAQQRLARRVGAATAHG